MNIVFTSRSAAALRKKIWPTAARPYRFQMPIAE
jgi:hypothetical protein